MYLYIGQNEILPEDRIIGVFDMDKCTAGKRERAYLDAAQRQGTVVDVSGELPRSFVVCTHPYHEQVVYLSQLSPATLRRRWELQEGVWTDTGKGAEP